MFSDAFSRDHQLIRADPKHSLYLACALLVRGNVQVSDLRRNIGRFVMPHKVILGFVIETVVSCLVPKPSVLTFPDCASAKETWALCSWHFFGNWIFVSQVKAFPALCLLESRGLENGFVFRTSCGSFPFPSGFSKQHLCKTDFHWAQRQVYEALQEKGTTLILIITVATNH